MEKSEVKKYIEETLSRKEKNSISVAIRCPNCSADGCEICGNGWIRPTKFLKEG